MGEAGTSDEAADTPGWRPPSWLGRPSTKRSLEGPIIGEELSAFESWLEHEFLVGAHPAMVALRKAILRAGAEEHPVLIRGESGTGKDLTADAIHMASRRRRREPVRASFASSGDRAGSDLFGHRKGAFTGALEDRLGCLASAHGKTLILDDVIDLPQGVQAMLLRAIETGKYRRLGDDTDSYADFRLLCTSNRCLREAAETGQFRWDLLHRLEVEVLELPPLRERLEDLDLLVPFLLARRSAAWRAVPRVENRGLDVLRGYSWPGNVRELENILVAARAADPLAEELSPSTLADVLARRGIPVRGGKTAKRSAPSEAEIRAAYRQHQGNFSKAAKSLQMTRSSLRRRADQLGLSSRLRGRPAKSKPEASPLDIKS